MVLDESVDISVSAHVTDEDRLERNGSPDNFFVKIQQGVEFVLLVEIFTVKQKYRQSKTDMLNNWIEGRQIP